MNIIGDVAGRYKELKDLLAKMPDEEIWLVGDIVDRGPESNLVVDLAMNNPKIKTILGNHELMMIEASEGGDELLWSYNGGDATKKSFGVNYAKDLPKDVISWMKQLPVFHKEGNLFLSHAPWPVDLYNLGAYASVHEVVWNRWFHPVPGVYQVYGHNGKIKNWVGQGMCVDNSMNKQVCGLHWPTKQFFFEDYR